jgi:hypothetical protein
VAYLFLVRPKVPRPHDYITFFCTLAFVVAHLFSLALWSFGLFRTGLAFFYILIVAALFGLALSVINVFVYYSPQLMWGHEVLLSSSIVTFGSYCFSSC